MKTKSAPLAALLMALLCAPLSLAQESSVRDLEKSFEAGTATRGDQLSLARAYVRAGRHYEASKIAERLLQADAADAEARQILDTSTAALRELGRAKVERARLAAERSGATDADRLALADAYFEVADYRAAAGIYGRLPSSALTRDARLRHARSLAWTGDYDRAERMYTALLREQSDAGLQLEYGRLLSWMGASAASIQTLSDVYKSAPGEESAIALANARAWNGDRTGAIDLLSEFTTRNPAAAEARALLREMQDSSELRLERADEQVDAAPYNLALRVERARLRYESGAYAGALRDIEFVREHAEQPIAGLDELERQAKERRERAIAALDERRRELESMPAMTSGAVDRSAERLSLAKAYTGHAAYDQALDLYEDHLAARPDDSEARLNYARVLSWDRRYAAAQRQYEILLRESPDRADLRYEYAQVLAYDSSFVPAVRTFRLLTDLSDNPRAHLYPDVPPKAHYNLGQIYRWYGWNETAIEQQNQALLINADYGPAREELTLARYQRPASGYGATMTFFEDANDLQFRRVDIDGQKWLTQQTAVEGAIGRHNFERGSLDAAATSLSAGVRHRFEDRLTGRARLGANLYDGGVGTRPFWGLGADWFMNLQTRTALDYNHYDLVYDVFTLESLGADGVATPGEALSIDDFRGRLNYDSGGFWSVLGDASYGFISDDNRRAALHGVASFRLLRSPFVAVKADGRYMSYDFRSNRYWSPTDYKSLAGVLQVGGDIRERFFWTLETKMGKSFERDRSSDIRTYHAKLTVPISDAFDLIGSYSYGKSGRFENLFGGSGDDFTNYWQRQWYVGLRVRQLFSSDDQRSPAGGYYYDNRVLTGSPVASPAGETR